MSVPVKRIHVPRGKELHTVDGKKQYVGPYFVNVYAKLDFPSTFTDGTKWEYLGAKAAPKVKKPRKKKTLKTKIVEPPKEKSDGPNDESVQTPRVPPQSGDQETSD